MDNTRESDSYIYSGPVINKYSDYTNTTDMQICGYCGYQFAGCYVHRFSVTSKKNGRTHDTDRCDDCREDMRQNHLENKNTDK